MHWRVVLTSILLIGSGAAFEATIPVVDMQEFYHPETKQKFIDQVAEALHTIGFFAVVNTGVDDDILEKGYKASQEFFTQSQDLKNEIYVPSTGGQRGYVPGETAQGSTRKDYKEFIHIAHQGNVWPTWMDLETPMMNLVDLLDRSGTALQQAFALGIGETEDFFADLREGECLLRTLHYPKNPAPGQFWAAPHTDIDFFTILPMATEEGLQVLHKGVWVDVKVPSGAFIVNGGDKLENLSNGYFKSCWHRVVSKPDVERYSMVYFVHPRLEDPVDPRPTSIAMTGGVAKYPKATSLEILIPRLRELGLASPALLQMEKECGILDRIQDLVEHGVAAEPVMRTYDIWRKQQE